ncbi:MAG: transporter ATP-binding protein [Frankiales bacterium]|nr:transporter ATP-binding protein [Frankiales bacterium]
MSELIVRCEDVGKTFGSGRTATVAVHGTSCEVRRGDAVAVVGPSGCGKSTLLHMLGGFERPTHGRIEWPGLPDVPMRAPQYVGFVFQAPSLVTVLDVAENVALPLLLAGRAADDIDRVVVEALAAVDLAGFGPRLPSELSGGQAQRVAVARVLAQRPTLILADEPTAQLDATHGRQVMDALVRAARSLDAALVVATHDSEVAGQLPMRWTLADGRLLEASAVSA